MKYLNNGFSQNMVKSKSFITISDELSLEAFELQSKDAKSVVSHEDLAELFGVQCHSEQISLGAGDIVYVLQLKDRRCLMDKEHTLSKADYKFMRVVVCSGVLGVIKWKIKKLFHLI